MLVLLILHLPPPGHHFLISIGQLKQFGSFVVGDGLVGFGVKSGGGEVFFAALIKMFCELDFVFFFELDILFDEVGGVAVSLGGFCGFVI